MIVLALVSDVYGAVGGIAKVNRDIFGALLKHERVEGVRALARAGHPEGSTPEDVDVLVERGGGAFVTAALRATARGGYGMVVCGHVHLASLAWFVARARGVPWVLVVHGVEVWGPPYWPATQGPVGSKATAWAVRHADLVVSVSELTKERVCRRFGVDERRVVVVPNAVDFEKFGPGPPRADLLERYGLEGRTVLMTLARLAPSERHKGVDKVIRAIPALARRVPDLSYLICGGGEDRARLEEEARALGVADRVVFSGYVPEEEKADHYRLADAFVMAGKKEGFGLVYLEALACGVPVLASSADASREAVLGGELGAVVDPDDQEALVSGILETLERPKGVPGGLRHFSRDRFEERWWNVLSEVA